MCCRDQQIPGAQWAARSPVHLQHKECHPNPLVGAWARHWNNSLSTEREGRHELIPDTGESNEETFQCWRSAWDYAMDHPEHDRRVHRHGGGQSHDRGSRRRAGIEWRAEETCRGSETILRDNPPWQRRGRHRQEKLLRSIKTAGVLDSMPIGMKSRYRRVKYSVNPQVA